MFFCHALVPRSDVLLIVPASTSHLLSDTASVEQAQLDGCHCCSWDVPATGVINDPVEFAIFAYVGTWAGLGGWGGDDDVSFCYSS